LKVRKTLEQYHVLACSPLGQCRPSAQARVSGFSFAIFVSVSLFQEPPPISCSSSSSSSRLRAILRSDLIAGCDEYTCSHQSAAAVALSLHNCFVRCCLLAIDRTASIDAKQGIAPGAARRYAPRRWQFDGGKNRGGSTSVRGRVRSPHISGGRRWLSCRQPACL